MTLYEYTQRWIKRAQADLELAKDSIKRAAENIEFEEDFLDLAGFHIQQAVEKGLKSLLVNKNQRMRKTPP